ncbi:hypothetical protein C7475_1021227 [Chitinophaga sp. S165]|nr:hypothetical protein C7475_1021227 [Chitinophaga sp. S165]
MNVPLAPAFFTAGYFTGVPATAITLPDISPANTLS